MNTVTQTSNSVQLFVSWQGPSTFKAGGGRIKEISVVVEGIASQTISLPFTPSPDMLYMLPLNLPSTHISGTAKYSKISSAAIAKEQMHQLTLQALVVSNEKSENLDQKPTLYSPRVAVQLPEGSLDTHQAYQLICKQPQGEHFALEAHIEPVSVTDLQQQQLMDLLVRGVLKTLKGDVLCQLTANGVPVQHDPATTLTTEQPIQPYIQSMPPHEVLHLLLMLQELDVQSCAEQRGVVWKKQCVDLVVEELKKSLNQEGFDNMIRAYLISTVHCDDQLALDKAIQAMLDHLNKKHQTQALADPQIAAIWARCLITTIF